MSKFTVQEMYYGLQPRMFVNMDEMAFSAKPSLTLRFIMPVETPFQYAVLESIPDVLQHVCLFAAMKPSFPYSSSSKVIQMDILQKLSIQSYRVGFMVAFSRKA